MNSDFWTGKSVFLTGHTGFKGSWLSIWLASIGAKIAGYALNPEYPKSLFNDAHINNFIEYDFREDIRHFDTLKKAIRTVNPEIIIHMAAQPLVSS